MFKPQAFPQTASFASRTLHNAGDGDDRPLYRSKPRSNGKPRPAGFKGRSLRAALLAHGASERRLAAVLAVAHVALETGQPLPWPRGFA